jgi:hypothetical protein
MIELIYFEQLLTILLFLLEIPLHLLSIQPFGLYLLCIVAPTPPPILSHHIANPRKKIKHITN